VSKNPGAVVTEYSWDASTCDPCPGPALYAQDFATLGDDVLPHADTTAPQRRYFAGGFTLTRLHTRYDKQTLGADLVFRAAPSIVGGREQYAQSGAIEHGAVAAGYNNFQARYVIRHLWEGAIACEHPRRGIWGGPPAGQNQQPTAAMNLAFAKRDGFQLASFVKGDVPEIGFAKSAVPAVTASAATSATPAPSASSSTTGASGGGCAGCTTSGDASPALLFPLAVMLLRRRRSPQ
jgi:uncharacterized protein (TIGR03382 family)